MVPAVPYGLSAQGKIIFISKPKMADMCFARQELLQPLEDKLVSTPEPVICSGV